MIGYTSKTICRLKVVITKDSKCYRKVHRFSFSTHFSREYNEEAYLLLKKTLGLVEGLLCYEEYEGHTMVYSFYFHGYCIISYLEL